MQSVFSNSVKFVTFSPVLSPSPYKSSAIIQAVEPKGWTHTAQGPLRFAARLLTFSATCLIGSPVGAIYHLAMTGFIE